MRLSAVSSSAIWDNFMIYNPVQFILCNNPGGFHLACSDTMLGKEKPNIFAIFPALCLCLTPWSNNGYSPAPRPCSFQSHPCSCQGGCSPCCARAAQSQGPSVATPAPAGLQPMALEALGRQGLLWPSEQGPAGLHCDSRARKIPSSMHGGGIFSFIFDCSSEYFESWLSKA